MSPLLFDYLLRFQKQHQPHSHFWDVKAPSYELNILSNLQGLIKFIVALFFRQPKLQEDLCTNILKYVISFAGGQK